MGKRTFWTGVVAGALIGGVVSLMNKNARKYAKEASLTTLENVTFYYKNPSIGLQEMKSSMDRFKLTVSETVDASVNALEQVETTMDRFKK